MAYSLIMEKKTTHRLIEEYGGPVKLARMITSEFGAITSQAISQWTIVPAERAMQIDIVTNKNIPKEALRPDLWS